MARMVADSTNGLVFDCTSYEARDLENNDFGELKRTSTGYKLTKIDLTTYEWVNPDNIAEIQTFEAPGTNSQKVIIDMCLNKATYLKRTGLAMKVREYSSAKKEFFRYSETWKKVTVVSITVSRS